MKWALHRDMLPFAFGIWFCIGSSFLPSGLARITVGSLGLLMLVGWVVLIVRRRFR